MIEVIVCPNCKRGLVAAIERATTVRCPKCASTWDLSSQEPEKEFRANDTQADRVLNHLNDTIADRIDQFAQQPPAAANAPELETLIAKVCAELDRSRTRYLIENVRAFVKANYAVSVAPSEIAMKLQELAEWTATRMWQGATAADFWQD